MTLAFFQTEGKVPVCSERLNNDVYEGTIVCPESLSRRALIISNPIALLGFKRLIASLTKLSEMSWKENPEPVALGLSSGWLGDDKSGNFSASFLPILTKKLFKTVAIDSSEVTTVPSTRRLEIFVEVFDDGKVFLSVFQKPLASPWFS